MKELRDKVAVVTGAGSGIGAGLVRAFAAEGMAVVAADVDAAAAAATADAVRGAGARALAQAVDVRDASALEGLAERCCSELGGCHLLCNNAGVMVNRPIPELEPGDWQWVLDVNLMGVIRGVAAFLPRMQAQAGEAHIVNTASVTGLVAMGSLGLGAYTTSKYAVVGYSEFLRAELAETPIGVSVMCPGAVSSQIARSERNRPAELATSARNLPEADPSSVAGAPGWEAISPDEAAACVVHAVRENLPYVITHPEMGGLVEMRHRAIAEAFADAKRARA